MFKRESNAEYLKGLGHTADQYPPWLNKALKALKVVETVDPAPDGSPEMVENVDVDPEMVENVDADPDDPAGAMGKGTLLQRVSQLNQPNSGQPTQPTQLRGSGRG